MASASPVASPSGVTVGARTACLSSFYKVLIRMGMLASNPCDALERPKAQQSPARAYTATDVQRVFAAIRDTTAGRRDRATIFVLVLTGRRRAEVIDRVVELLDGHRLQTAGRTPAGIVDERSSTHDVVFPG